MARGHQLVFAMNAGAIDPEAIARVDLEKSRLAGEHPVANWLPRVLGPMTLRPGTESLTDLPSQTRQIGFTRAVGTSYILLLSAGEMRISDAGVIQQVPAVSTTIGSGSWTDVSTSPATATGGATLSFAATSTASARLRQAVSVALADQSVVNVLRVVVSRGPVFLRIGTTSGGQELLSDARLDTGTHKIGVTPGTATIYVEIRADDPVARSVSSINFETVFLGGAGDLVIPTPWSTFADVEALRTWLSIDTMFCGDGVLQQRKIEHRGPLSWGVSLYEASDGPYVLGTSRISMTPGALTGNTTVTASEAYFRTGHEESLIELTQTGKTVEETFNANGQTSDYVTIVGVDEGRWFYRTGFDTAFIGTVVLERSFDVDEPVSWTTYLTYTDAAVGFAVTVVDDTLDNLVAHYRWRVTAYTSGSCVMRLVYESDVQTGRARILTLSSSTVANVEVIRSFGNTNATRTWRRGAWSSLLGWPRIPIIHDGRLHWFRNDDDFGSYVDDYYSFSDSATGDSAPFTRSVGSGSEEGVVWAISQDRLIVGTPAFEAAITASELDEPLTQTRYTVRRPSKRGCADIEAVEHDDGLFFVQRSRRKLFELSNDGQRYKSQDVSRMNPAAYVSGVVRLAVQQQPNIRLYAVLDDGTMSVLTWEREDKVVAITTIEIAGGLVEDVCVTPETDQDDVYLIVNRGGTRYHERFAKEAHQFSLSTCALLDAHKVLTGSVSSITGGTHLASQTVNVWADGLRRTPVTLDGSGVAALGATYGRVVYGLAYDAEFTSVKLAYAAEAGTALEQTKIVRKAGLILKDSVLDGLTIGRSATNSDPMPPHINGALRTTGQMVAHYDQDLFPIPHDWGTDPRLYIKADSSYGPVTVQAVVLDVETRDGGGRSAA